MQGVTLAQFCAAAQMYEETGALDYSQSNSPALVRLLDNATTVVTGIIASQTPTAAGSPTGYISQYTTKPASLDRATSATGAHVVLSPAVLLKQIPDKALCCH